MKRVSRISSSKEFAVEDRREVLRDHRAARRDKSVETVAASACSVLIAARPILIALAAAITTIHAPAIVAEIAKLV
jgi:hypothetical protein